MDYLVLIFSGVLMGLIAAVPIGPVNLICIRRTFAYGPVNGFVSGLGAALGDGVFAAVIGFGLTWVVQIIHGHADIIELIGGAMLVYFGVHMFVAPPLTRMDENSAARDKGASTLVRATASTFALTITNPVTLATFTAMFAARGAVAGGQEGFAAAGLVVAGVVGGSTAWWLALTTLIGLFHARIDDRIVRIINRCFGVLVATCGLAVLVHVIVKVFWRP